MITDDQFKNFLLKECELDAAHDLSHILRVVSTAQKLCLEEGADEELTTTAAWLHDCVVLPKNHPDRAVSSQMAAAKASSYLKSQSFPKKKIPGVVHAIEAHSYSAAIMPVTLEAKILRDADRLDALGAIGIARCFTVGGDLNRALYQPSDPFCENRDPNDSVYTIDHFYEKLFTLPDTMITKSAKTEAVKRVDYMRDYLDRLKNEIS